jgi:hypothetical protein
LFRQARYPPQFIAIGFDARSVTFMAFFTAERHFRIGLN